MSENTWKIDENWWKMSVDNMWIISEKWVMTTCENEWKWVKMSENWWKWVNINGCCYVVGCHTFY